MNPLLILLIILFVVGPYGGYRYGGPYLGGGVGLVLLIVLLVYLFGGGLR